jgi:hypothetical protein
MPEYTVKVKVTLVQKGTVKITARTPDEAQEMAESMLKDGPNDFDFGEPEETDGEVTSVDL